MAKQGSKKGRAKGSGYIFQRRPGGNYYLEYKINNIRKTISLKTKNKKDADKKTEEILKPAVQAKTKEQVLLNVAESKKLLKRSTLILDQTWKVFSNMPVGKGKAQRPPSSSGTLGNYERNWNQFKDWLNEHYPKIDHFSDEINADIAFEYSAYLWDSGISANTYNYKIGTLKLIARVLEDKANLSKNVWLEVGRKSAPQKTKKLMSFRDVLELLKIFDDDKFEIFLKSEMRTLFYIGAYTGLRLADCCLLKWDDVDLKDGLIRSRPIKTIQFHKSVSIPILPELRRELKAIENKDQKIGYVLPKIAERYLHKSKKGGDSGASGIRKDVVKVFSEFGFETSVAVDDKEPHQRKQNISLYGFHSLRHALFSYFASCGVTLDKLAVISGDSDRTLAKYYIRTEEESLKKDIESKVLPDIKSLFLEPEVIDVVAVEVNSKREQINVLLNSATDEQLDEILKILGN